MLKRYKNLLFHAVTERDLNPSDFEVDEVSDAQYHTFSLDWANSGLQFKVRQEKDAPSNFDCLYTSIGSHRIITYPPDDYANFTGIIEQFHSWLSNEVEVLLEEETLPDLWTQARGQRELMQAGAPNADTETTFFSEEERTQIRFSLQNFKQLVEAEFEPEPEQAELIHARLDYLAESVDRLNRYDWKGVALSTVIGIATTLTLDTQRGQVLWGLFKTAFRAVFQLMGG